MCRQTRGILFSEWKMDVTEILRLFPKRNFPLRTRHKHHIFTDYNRIWNFMAFQTNFRWGFFFFHLLKEKRRVVGWKAKNAKLTSLLQHVNLPTTKINPPPSTREVNRKANFTISWMEIFGQIHPALQKSKRLKAYHSKNQPFSVSIWRWRRLSKIVETFFWSMDSARLPITFHVNVFLMTLLPLRFLIKIKTFGVLTLEGSFALETCRAWKKEKSPNSMSHSASTKCCKGNP